MPIDGVRDDGGGVPRRHGDSRVYLSDSHGTNHAGDDFRVAPRENARRDSGYPTNAVGGVDASADAAAREMRRMRISAILRGCVVNQPMKIVAFRKSVFCGKCGSICEIFVKA